MRQDARTHAVIRGQLQLLMEHLDCAMRDASREAEYAGRELTADDEAFRSLMRWKQMLLRWRREIDQMYPGDGSRP